MVADARADRLQLSKNELVPRDDQPTVNARRTQKVYADIQGRTYKTEVVNWDGTTPYATSVETFNGRDQITNTRQYAGSTTSSTYRDVTMSYDGHGRMKTRHYPIEDAATNTTWNYNADDSIQMVIDPCGVITNFAYYPTNGLVQTISYNLPFGSTIPNTPNVSFSYDNLGNRTQMTDGTGSTGYAYNSLSQLTSETKTITELSQSYTINYTYNLSGGVKSISDPLTANQQVNYNFDKIGRTIGADEVSQGSTVQNVANTKFRAWGAIKEYQYNDFSLPPAANPKYENFTYDSRLLVSSFQRVFSVSETISYQRSADGKVKSTSNNSTLWFDRSFEYDQVGRLIKGLSGREANNNPNVLDTPYRTIMNYNAFSDVTGVGGKHWGVTVSSPAISINNQTGRNGTSGYDAAGNVTQERIDTIPTIINRTLTNDAAGRQVQTFDPKIHSWENDNTYTNTFDGNGWRVKNAKLASSGDTEQFFEIRSTVLNGEMVGRLRLFNNSPQKRFMVAVNGMKIVDDNLLGKALESIAPEGIKAYSLDNWMAELDPRGSDVGLENPYNVGGAPGGSYTSFSDATNYARCTWEGLALPCEKVSRLTDSAGYRASNKFDYETKKMEVKKVGKEALAHESMHNTLPAKTLTKTTKPADAPDTTEMVATAAVPSEDGSTKDGCEYDKDGKPMCMVQSEKAIDDPVLVDASQSGSTKLTTRELKKIADDIQSIFDNNPDCLKFINGILENAQSDANPVVSKNPLDVFWAIAQQGGFFFVPTKKGEQSAGQAFGSIGSDYLGAAKVTLPPNGTFNVPGASKRVIMNP